MPQIVHATRTSPKAACAAFASTLALVLIMATAQAAVVDVKPYASYDWQSDHNPFLAPDPNSGATLVTRPNVDDKVTTLVAGLNLNHDAGYTNTYVSGEGRKIAYATFDAFNHTEYTAALGHKRGSATGNQFGIEFGSVRQFTAFDVLAADTPVAYQTRRYGRLTGELHLATRNVFTASFERSYQRLPIAGAPDFNSVQSLLQVGYGRLVGTTTTVGVRALGLSGSQYIVGATTPYRQVTPEFYLNYNRTGLLQADLAVGATHRTQEGTTGMKGMVGNARINYTLTAKTAVHAGVQRQVTGYYVAGGSQATTAWSAGIGWRATDRFDVALDAVRTHGLYEVPGLAGNRTDDLDAAQLQANWKPKPWLIFSLLGQVQKRASTSVDYRFDANSVGLAVRVQRP